MEPTNNTDQLNQFEIPESRLQDLDRRMGRLAKTAAKLGVTAPSYTTVGEEFRLFVYDGHNCCMWAQPKGEETVDTLAARYERAGKRTKLVRYVSIVVSGQAPKLAGWRFLAKLEHTEAGTMVQKIEQAPVPEKYRTAEPVCDHCQTNRRRTDTYVVIDEIGDTRQVGRSCMKDFTGHKSPEQVAAACLYFEQLSGLGEYDEDMDEDGPRGRRVEKHYSLVHVLELAAYCSREFGYVTKAESQASFNGLQATGSRVFGYLVETDPKKKPTIEDQDVQLAEAALAWVKTQNASPDNDYMWNLTVIAELGVVASKRVGLAASMIRSYQRGLEFEVKRRVIQDQGANSRHFGAPKERAVYTFTIVSCTTRDSDYGVQYVYKFVSPEGNLATWWGSNELPMQPDGYCLGPGDVVKVKATVKKHGEYRGVQETTITRVALEEVVERSVKPEPEQQVAA